VLDRTVNPVDILELVVNAPRRDSQKLGRTCQSRCKNATLIPAYRKRKGSDPYALAGGDIRNVALDAAFLAAQDGQVVTMKQLIVAMARQLMKQGRIPSPTDFKQYHALISQSE
jgi:hypothetical protein